MRAQFDGIVRDAGYAFRSLRKSPGFSAIAIFTMALGISGSVAIFGVVDAVLLRPLPFPEPDRLFTVWETNAERGRAQSLVAPPTFVDWREQAESFTEMSALSLGSPTLTGGALPERMSAIAASPNIFALLGVSMLVGGPFPLEAEQPGGGNWVVVSYGFWQRWFGGDPGAVGRTLVLDDEVFAVVGVLPMEFRFPETADLWLPLSFGAGQLTEGMRGARYIQVVARLRADVNVDQARAEMAMIADVLGERHAINSGWGVSLIGLHENMVLEFRRSLTLLQLATILVLIIACVNMVNLVLARTSDRSRETAVRLALGATRRCLFRQVLAQHVALAVLGGTIGALVASVAIAPLLRLAPVELPRIEDVAIDVLSVLVGVVLSFVSMWSSVGSDPTLTLRSAQIGGAPTRHRVRRLLIVAEVGLSLVLLIGAGLFVRSFVRLQRVDPGFSPTGITAVSLSLPRSRYGDRPQQAVLFRALIERLAESGEVSSVGATTNLPLSGSAMSFGFSIDNRPEASLDEQLSAEYHAVTPGYFRTMGISLRSGRALDWRDDAAGVPVVIVNETLARRYWPNEDPLGKSITVISQDGPTSRVIVGVVADVRHAGLASVPRVEVYVPLSQDPWAFVTLVLEAPDATEVAQLVRTELTAVDAALPLGAVVPIERLVSRWLAPLRFQTVLVGLFAVTALLLAVLGIYGVISYLVCLRTNEIGVRLALGAHAHHVFGSVVAQGVGLAAAGVVFGYAVAFLATKHLSTLLFEVSPTDPLVFLTVPGLVVGVAVLACVLPAQRAVRVDPVEALRDV
jgi:putative ABC transport system permease protein